ncbi:hypothetical protein ACFW1A_27900 [Kitasatospora sp. NPDC058965]|uniref:hypothetical protein n=1 Tax=Kitasatospora sp. NPDC058965 TaxID=3346682 RepID=UPI00368DFE18
MTTLAFFRPPHPCSPSRAGDAVAAPAELLSGPGRSWDAEPRWRWVEIRLGGEWRAGQVQRWRLHQGSVRWVALVRWGPRPLDRGWYLCSPDTVRQVPAPAAAPDRATW